MNLVLILAGLGVLLLPGATSGLGGHLAPRDWARLTAASMRGGLLAIRLGLLFTAAPVVLRLVGVQGLAEACHQTLGPFTPGGAAAGIASAALLVLVETRIRRTRRNSRTIRARLRIEPWLGHHEHHGDHDIVVVPAAPAIAYAVGGRPGQVVLSQGLVSALDDDELAVVVRHERCHLNSRHQRWLDLALVTEVTFGSVRVVRRSSATLRLAIERWADEDAAAGGSRATVRAALSKVVDTMLTPVPAFNTAETIAARLGALEADLTTTSPRWLLAASAPFVALCGAAGVALTRAAHIDHGVLDLVGLCLGH